MAELKAITFDLWGTILYPRDAEAKIQRRRAIILAALRESGLEIDVERLRAAFRAAAAIIHGDIARGSRDIGPAARWVILSQQLGLPPNAVPYSRIAEAYEELTLEFLPPLMPGAAAAIEGLQRSYRLGLICNTGYTGGAVLREVLERHGLRQHFDLLLFSNEFGWLKPDPKIFLHALAQLGVQPSEAAHVGDFEAHDVAGARAAGMLSVHYLPEGGAESSADVVFQHWDQLEDTLKVATNSRSTREKVR